MPRKPAPENRNIMSRRRETDPGFSLGKVKVTFMTDKALKVEFLDHPEYADVDGLFIPKSQIHETSKIDDTSLIDDEDEMVITTWLANQKGLISE
jgi:hypothetical protein